MKSAVVKPSNQYVLVSHHTTSPSPGFHITNNSLIWSPNFANIHVVTEITEIRYLFDRLNIHTFRGI